MQFYTISNLTVMRMYAHNLLFTLVRLITFHSLHFENLLNALVNKRPNEQKMNK